MDWWPVPFMGKHTYDLPMAHMLNKTSRRRHGVRLDSVVMRWEIETELTGFSCLSLPFQLQIAWKRSFFVISRKSQCKHVNHRLQIVDVTGATSWPQQVALLVSEVSFEVPEPRATKVRSEGLAVDPGLGGWVRTHPPGGMEGFFSDPDFSGYHSPYIPSGYLT